MIEVREGPECNRANVGAETGIVLCGGQPGPWSPMTVRWTIWEGIKVLRPTIWNPRIVSVKRVSRINSAASEISSSRWKPREHGVGEFTVWERKCNCCSWLNCWRWNNPMRAPLSAFSPTLHPVLQDRWANGKLSTRHRVYTAFRNLTLQGFKNTHAFLGFEKFLIFRVHDDASVKDVKGWPYTLQDFQVLNLPCTNTATIRDT